MFVYLFFEKKLLDPVVTVRVAAAGALRNIAIAGQEEFCSLMIKFDVVNGLIATLQQVKSTFISKKLEGDELSQAQNLLIQVLALLANLASFDEKVISALVSTPQLLSGLTNFLRSDLFSADLSSETASLLMTVTEDHRGACEQLAGSADALIQLISNESQNRYVRLASSITVLNVLENLRQNQQYQQILTTVVVPLVWQTISIDLSSLLNEMIKLEPLVEKVLLRSAALFQTNLPTNDDAPKPEVSAEKKLQQWNALVLAQQLAFEYFADQFSNLTESLERKPNLSASDKALLEQLAPSKLVALLVTTTVNSFQSPLFRLFSNPSLAGTHNAEDSDFYQSFKLLQERLLSCLEPILLCPPAVHQLSSQLIADVFRFLSELLMSILLTTNNNNSTTSTKKSGQQHLKEGVATCFSALLESQKEIPQSPVWPALTAQHLQMFATLATSSSDEVIRICGCALLGLVGSKSQTHKELLFTIGTGLIPALGDVSWGVVHQSLDSIFDLFAEPPVNDVVAKLDLINHLKKALQKLQQYKSNSDPEVDDLVDESKENLVRFLKYKADQK